MPMGTNVGSGGVGTKTSFSNGIKKTGISGLVNPKNMMGMAVPGAFAIWDASRDIKEGKNPVAAIGKAAATQLFYMTDIGNTYFVASMIGQIVGAGWDTVDTMGRKNASQSYQMYRGQFGGYYNLSKNGYTMRQRGLSALQNATQYKQQVLGSEARSYYRGMNKNYY